ncbi:hypothetical protein PAXRUDRAFT_33050 [Paxillus rubicundulus Ve08.2h10]|uniref:Uncharacterized protein n=1 Tax=Paxillus rubicundulus Ve08.2h10 TaxID=930991 RepID=A0A0D0DR42_9AGAM|nr:hypothetical protein PAXRUDRAFT_33050 [Paxillus rubicundulus Ve08.2h10]
MGEKIQDGHLQESGLFVKIAEAMADKITRTQSNNLKAKHGIHYDSEVLNFFIAMRGYGGQSAVQYNLLSQVIGAREDIERIIKEVIDENSMASQVRVLIGKIPILPTGPLVTIPDPSHVQKVLRNNEQSGTHLLTLGNHCLSHRTLVALRGEDGSGLVKKDIENTDKQDDSVAIRLFHSNALCATLMPDERIHAAMRAKFFLQLWYNHVTNKAKHPLHGHFFPFRQSFISTQNFKSLDACCDALVKLAVVHREYYPTVPFLPWQHGSLLLEKLFGIAREFLPNFSYVEFLRILRHTEQQQESGIHEHKDKSSGYIHDTTLEKLSIDDLKKLADIPSRLQMEDIANVAWEDVVAIFKDHANALHHMTRLSALMTDIKELEEQTVSGATQEVVVPSILNLLNPAPPSNRPSDHANVIPITTQHQMLDIAAVVHLWKSHDQNSAVLSERSFEHKAIYAPYAPTTLTRASRQLNDAARMLSTYTPK